MPWLYTICFYKFRIQATYKVDITANLNRAIDNGIILAANLNRGGEPRADLT